MASNTQLAAKIGKQNLVVLAAGGSALMLATSAGMAQIDEVPDWMAPVANAVGMGMLSATLFSDEMGGEGPISSIAEGTRSQVVQRILGWVLGFGVLYYCQILSAGASSSAADFGDFLHANLGLIAAVAINFALDGVMAGVIPDSVFESGKPPSMVGKAIKIILDNLILIVALGVRAKKAGLSAEDTFAFLGGITGLYAAVQVVAGVYLTAGLRTPGWFPGNPVKNVLEGIVPVVLLWTVFMEFAPDAFDTDDDELKTQVVPVATFGPFAAVAWLFNGPLGALFQ
jgi:hypothetical protein